MNPALLVEFVLLGAIWGASFLFMRLSVVDFGALPTAFVRVSVAAAFLLPILLWKREGRILLRHWKALLVVGLLNSAIPFACFSFALLAWFVSPVAMVIATTIVVAILYSREFRSEVLHILRD
mgnify:CR=1 FL=1